jgi:hypothetical protein
MDLQGEEVLTPCGWSTYKGPWITQRNAPLVEVQFADGSTVRCTPEHLFLTESGWKSAESLLPNTLIRLCSIPSSSISMDGYTDAGLAKFTIDVPLIVRWGQSLRYLADYSSERYGKALLGRFQKAVKSIIATITPPITFAPIWNACLSGSTGRKRGEEFIATGLFLTRREKLPLHGIGLKQVGCGTDEWRRNLSHGENANANSKTVHSAVLNLWLSFAASIRRSFARRHASLLAVTGVQSLTERADVCCIEVPDIHCFALANGVIVHNSHCADSFRTLAVSIRQPQKEREREQQRHREYASPWT